MEVGMTWGSVKNSGEACVFCTVLYGGQSPPYNYNTKYTSLPRVFDTPSSHSNFNSDSTPHLNSKSISKLPKMHSAASGHARVLAAPAAPFLARRRSFEPTLKFSEAPEALQARFFARAGRFCDRPGRSESSRARLQRSKRLYVRHFVTSERPERLSKWLSNITGSTFCRCVPTSPPSSKKKQKKN